MRAVRAVRALQQLAKGLQESVCYLNDMYHHALWQGSCSVGPVENVYRGVMMMLPPLPFTACHRHLWKSTVVICRCCSATICKPSDVHS